ncbi:MAG TPA: hypothetical protein VEM57_03170 [Candidatus Binatus sp.]|nr:hypothetical protein [Candidatus Binatus sp.]
MRRFSGGIGSVVALAAAAGLGSSAGAARTNICQLTTRQAIESCKLSARSDKAVAVGKCANGADPAARKTCLQQASADTKDALKTCTDERGVRETSCMKLGPAAYHAAIDPANFVAAIDNPYFPLKPGTRFVYEGQTPQGLEHVEFFVTHNTKVILGVTCVEVHDTVQTAGQLTEDTLDWFAQDKDGNVWYFGEHTMELEGGLATTLAGTFVAGVAGAQPGIIMEAHPAIGDFYRQEFDLRNAEDFAEVVSLKESVTAGGVAYTNCLKTKETTPLEPDLLENKFYAANVGNIMTLDATTGQRSELISVTME